FSDWGLCRCSRRRWSPRSDSAMRAATLARLEVEFEPKVLPGSRAHQTPLLLIEDDADLRRLLLCQLADAGYRACSTGLGRVALAHAMREPPRLLILDLELPDMDGWVLAREWRDHRATADVPILVASATDQRPAVDVE